MSFLEKEEKIYCTGINESDHRITRFRPQRLNSDVDDVCGLAIVAVPLKFVFYVIQKHTTLFCLICLTKYHKCCLMTSVIQRLVLWALDEDIPGSIPCKSDLGNVPF